MSQKADNYNSPNEATIVELDPNNNGSTVRKAFLIESIFNLFTIPLITHPKVVLSYTLNDPSHITPATVLFARLFGAIIVGGLTSALWSGLPNTRTAIESRRTVYITLGMGEVLMIPLLWAEALKGGRGDQAGLSVKACVATIACLVPPLLWRGYVLFLKPELIGRYRGVKRE